MTKINQINERNVRVEADKAWERSLTRRVIIAVGTYFISVFVLFSINSPTPFLTALVPSIGYILSTLTLPFLKAVWLGIRS
ncbi:hypothetical protein HZC07_02085 [Candidatus Micrarchaeota archaeon]|nr:hypothetical protein [Candidatus Micrarchaeota archaeon]